MSAGLRIVQSNLMEVQFHHECRANKKKPFLGSTLFAALQGCCNWFLAMNVFICQRVSRDMISKEQFWSRHTEEQRANCV